MEADARRVLDIIDLQLEQINQASKELWDVLTALRAPDDPDLHMRYKDTNTLHIRDKAFPRAMAAGVLGKPYLSLKTLEGHPDATIAKRAGMHWLSHALPAAEALGLE